MDKPSFIESIYDMLAKVWVLFLYLILGTVGKFSYNMMNGKRLTMRQAFGQLGICLVCGIMAYQMCEYFGWLRAQAIITTVATFVSDKVTLAVYSLDWQKVINNLFNSFKSNK